MNQIKRKWDRLSEIQRKHAIDSVAGWYEKEKSEKIGYLASEAVLDMVLELVSDIIYSKGISDTRKIVEQRLEDLKVDLDLLGYEK